VPYLYGVLAASLAPAPAASHADFQPAPAAPRLASPAAAAAAAAVPAHQLLGCQACAPACLCCMQRTDTIMQNCPYTVTVVGCWVCIAICLFCTHSIQVGRNKIAKNCGLLGTCCNY